MSRSRSGTIRFFHVVTIAIVSIPPFNPATAADSVWSGADPAVIFMRERARDARHPIEGLQPPTPHVVPPDLSCVEMYARRVALLRRRDDYKPPYWDDPRNRAAVFVGTIFSPPFYFLAYSGVTEYLETARGTGAAVEAEIDALRQASA